MSNELWRDSALGLANQIRTSEVSSREVIDAHLARIEGEMIENELGILTPIEPVTS